MLDEQRKSTFVPIQKNKGDSQNCKNYRDIKLKIHKMNL